ncbi:hypothetical protein EMPS_01095 [Entomortierella parvispora]|uniref:Stress response protein NST1 n=1 Tax=Entomortierella parvispora TaxID=205924 RepID=A0A9P3H2C8_9FUNG|nr:hypothetical protein EMPS_01095 [Entomortierella parvispora]
MAAHTFAPEDALPPPKSAVIYSRDGRKRSLNIDMTKHFAPSHQSQPPTPLLPLSVNAPPSVAAAVSAAAAGSTANNHSGHAHPGDPSLYAIAGGNQAQSNTNGAHHVGSTNAPQRKKKKKRSKKKPLGRIEESLLRPGQSSNTGAGFLEHEHQADCQHDHHQGHHHDHHHHDSSRHHHHHHDDEDEDDEDFFSDEETYATAADGSADHQYDDSQSTGVPSAAGEGNGSKKKKKKRKKSSTTGTVSQMAHSLGNHHNHNHGHNHTNGSSSKAIVSSQSSHRNGHDHGSMVKHMHDNHTQNDGFWHYSDAEERQRIREFWFQLREEERRSLVRVEKEAVLKKMKEQQRHSCSCSLCGRKRTAIEEELELLYDAYYDELEQYANQQQPSDGHVLPYSQHSATFEDDDLSDESRGSDEEDEDEDDEDDEDDDEEGYEDDDEDDEEYEDDISNRKTSFPYSNGFPNALQAKGNILTVAEDLLENDGKKFLEMMDRLADRKVQRDDELMDNRGVYEEYDDEEEGEFEDEGPEEDALTKEQRMEEGRRMFQAFAARMFEQRVLSAYREKVAQERQERLLAELEEESRQEQLREERKEREKEKKRDKKRLQRQQKEEERAAKEAQKLAEEKRLLEERERKLEADRKRREEERRIKEEEKRLREEERLKKEEERKRKLKEEKAREIEKERKRKEDLLAKEHEVARKALEASKEEALRLERETQLKQQLLEEQQRQEELRRQEQQVHEEAALTASNDNDQEIVESTRSSSPAATDAPSSPVRGRTTTTGSDSSAALAQMSATQSPVSPPGMTVASSSVHPQLAQGPMTGQMWSTPYPSQQPVPPQHFQLSHSNMQQQQQHHQPFPQPVQQGLFRPTNQFGQIGEQDVFASRVASNAGRGPFMGGASHHNQTMFSAMNQHQLPSTPVGGLRSPGLAPVGYGAVNVPGKQLLNLMSPGSSSNAHDMASSNGSPLHSPSTLGSIPAPIGTFGPISPIGHSRRTSTAHGSTTDTIKPIQRPVPIGRPKDTGAIANSFDGLNLGLSGLAIGSEIDRRSRSPPRSLGGGSLESLDGVALRKDSLRSSESHGNLFSSDTGSLPRQMDSSGSLQQPGSSNRGQRDTSFFSNSFFGSRVNSHDPFFQGNDFLNYGQQGHGSLPNSHFLSGYPMHMPSSPQHQSQQQQLFLQQQQQFMHPSMQELQLQQQQQQLGMNSPPLNGTSGSWGRAGFMQPPLMNGISANGSVSLGLTSPPTRALSPPPLGLHNGSHSPLLPIGPPSNGGSSGHLNQYNNFGGNGTNGLGLTVGSGRKSVSHLPPMRNEGVSSGLESAANGLMGTGFPPGYGAHPLQQQQQQQQHHAHSQQQLQQQQQLHAHRLGAIGEVGGANGGLREGNFSL